LGLWLLGVLFLYLYLLFTSGGYFWVLLLYISTIAAVFYHTADGFIGAVSQMLSPPTGPMYGACVIIGHLRVVIHRLILTALFL